MITHIQFAFAWTAVALIAMLALSVPAENVAMAYDGKTVTVTEKDGGGKVSLGKGDTLVVRVESQRSTGYIWKIVKNDGAVLKQSGPPEYEKTEKPLPGAKGIEIFRFRAEASGTSELELQYARPFEKDKAPAKTFKLTVKVD
jgi:inhibitor of cysteine peptidase